MAGDADNEDKTESPSQKRLDQAREEGRAPLSREVPALVVLASGAWLLSVYAPKAVRESAAVLTRLLSEAHLMALPEALGLARRGLVGVVWPFALAGLVASALGVLTQTRFLLKMSALQPDFGRLSPLAGLMRIVGPHNLMEAAKSLVKVVVVGGVGWLTLEKALPQIAQSMSWAPGILADRIARQVLSLMVAMLGVQGVIAAVDVLRTQLAHNASLRMTRQEQRDEAKDSEGDPHIKGKLRQIRHQRARRRMMQAVPTATVVVTNPTHYAVALLYEKGGTGAPKIVAKGVDEMAARIREVAKTAGVPLMANPPLARALYPLPLDSEIPAEHFKAVAELIAYVWRLKSPRPARAPS